MKKLFFITAAILLFGAGSGKCFCQPYDITQILDEWIGEWETSYEVTSGIAPGMAKEKITMSGAENNFYLQIHSFGWMAGDSAKYHWTEDEFLTYDLTKKEISGFFLNSNGAEYSETLKGDWEEGSNRIIREGESRMYKTKITWEVKDGKLHKQVEDTNKKENKKEKIERVFTKTKSK
jgi:hypothetical protein